jgi:hypothetical protein
MKNHNAPPHRRPTPFDVQNAERSSTDGASSARKPFVPPRIQRESGLVDGTASTHNFS